MVVTDETAVGGTDLHGGILHAHEGVAFNDRRLQLTHIEARDNATANIVPFDQGIQVSRTCAEDSTRSGANEVVALDDVIGIVRSTQIQPA